MAAAAPAIFFGDLLVLAHGEARLAAVAPMRRRMARRLFGYSVMFTVLGASALFHAVANNNYDPDTSNLVVFVAAAGFLLWVAGATLLLLAVTADLFPAASRLAARLVEAFVAAFF